MHRSPPPDVRVALAQINPIVGDLAGNALLIRQALEKAVRNANAHALSLDLVLFGEMTLTGYPIEDLALRPDFQQASRQSVHNLARDLAADGYGDITVIVGFLDFTDTDQTTIPSLGRPKGGPKNSAAVIRNGSVIATYDKHFLPNYGVFDEARYFVAGTKPLVIDVDGARVAIAICEDLWREGGPVTWARESRADILAVLNASPFEHKKDSARLALCQDRARESGAVVLYCNIVGGQDELVFDGASMIVSAEGNLLARAHSFDSEVLVIDLSEAPGNTADPTPNALIAPTLGELDEVYRALVVGLSDYVNKNHFASVIFGASGGIDSALVGAIAVDALGPDRVFALAMPSPYSSEHSVADAYELARRTGLSLRTVAIKPMFDSFMSTIELSGLAEENLQARIRGMTLMAHSNQEGHLVLATGNKSELSVGYSTIYGDAVGGFAPIKDVPKTLVWDLSRARNLSAEALGETPPIPPNSIEKEPSAELRPDQLDSDSLPDYKILDAILENYINHDSSADEVRAAGFDPETVQRILNLTDNAEYKRRQYPPGTKITPRSFGRDRRLPITNQFRQG